MLLLNISIEGGTHHVKSTFIDMVFPYSIFSTLHSQDRVLGKLIKTGLWRGVSATGAISSKSISK